MRQTDNFDRVVPDEGTTTQARNRGELRQWCDLAAGIEVIRGQWKASILVCLSEAPCAVPHLQRRLAPADRRVLVRALRELETDALLHRCAPDNVIYTLTPDGAALAQILFQLAAWQEARTPTGLPDTEPPT